MNTKPPLVAPSSVVPGSPLLGRIREYLGNGGLFNPEMTDHYKVRDLIIASRDEIARLGDVLKRIGDMTDADNPESYRSDDREGCLDTVHDVARAALANQ